MIVKVLKVTSDHYDKLEISHFQICQEIFAGKVKPWRERWILRLFSIFAAQYKIRMSISRTFFHFEFPGQKNLNLCIYCGMRIINLDFHFGVHERCGEMELRRRWSKFYVRNIPRLFTNN